MIHPTRTVALSFRVTPDELDVLRQSAGEQSVSDFIRTRLFDYAAMPVAKRLPGEADAIAKAKAREPREGSEP